MNDLVSGNVVTMSSLELVEFINKERKLSNEPQLRHDNLMQKIPKVLGLQAPSFEGTSPYTNGAGNLVSRVVYNLPKREACLVAMSYSYELQAKVFDRMTELEQGNKPSYQIEDPIKRAEAWILEYKEKLELSNNLNLANGRIEKLIHNNKSYTCSEIAKELNLKSAKALNDILVSLKFQYMVNDSWVLYSKYSDKGYTVLKQSETNSGKIVYHRHFTGLGREFILDLLKDINNKTGA
jgi:phage antirepressor YoqD-like protein